MGKNVPTKEGWGPAGSWPDAPFKGSTNWTHEFYNGRWDTMNAWPAPGDGSTEKGGTPSDSCQPDARRT